MDELARLHEHELRDALARIHHGDAQRHGDPLAAHDDAAVDAELPGRLREQPARVARARQELGRIRADEVRPAAVDERRERLVDLEDPRLAVRDLHDRRGDRRVLEGRRRDRGAQGRGGWGVAGCGHAGERAAHRVGAGSGDGVRGRRARAPVNCKTTATKSSRLSQGII